MDGIWKQTNDFKELSAYFKVSQIVIARSTLDLGKITRNHFFDFYNDHISKAHTAKARQSTGSDFYKTAKNRISLTFAAHIGQAVKSGQLLYRDAYKLTGLKGETYKMFFDKYFKR